MAVELVILAPLLVLVMMFVVALGRYVDSRGVVESITRDAVRAASLERNYDAGIGTAQDVVNSSLRNVQRINCDPVELIGPFESGEVITVRLTCSVSYPGLGSFVPLGEGTITRESSAPIDEFRRTG